VNDTIGVYIYNKSNPLYKPYAIRAANAVTAVTKISTQALSVSATPGVATIDINSWEATFPDPTLVSTAVLNDLSDTKVIWNKIAACDNKKWLIDDENGEISRACYGVWKPWVFNTHVVPSST
jgi:hypothetical protein